MDLTEEPGFTFHNKNLCYQCGLLAQGSEEEFESIKSDPFDLKCEIITRGNWRMEIKQLKLQIQKVIFFA